MLKAKTYTTGIGFKNRKKWINVMVSWIVFYAVSAIFQTYNGGKCNGNFALLNIVITTKEHIHAFIDQFNNKQKNIFEHPILIIFKASNAFLFG